MTKEAIFVQSQAVNFSDMEEYRNVQDFLDQVKLKLQSGSLMT